MHLYLVIKCLDLYYSVLVARVQVNLDDGSPIKDSHLVYELVRTCRRGRLPWSERRTSLVYGSGRALTMNSEMGDDATASQLGSSAADGEIAYGLAHTDKCRECLYRP